MHQIGEAAEATGLSLRTIRFYEEVGLVVPSERTSGGFRLYTDDDIERLGLIKQMKPLEFSLEEMRELLELRDRLAEHGGGRHDSTALLERLAMFAAAAEARCERLREQLAAAETFAHTLRREVSRGRSKSRVRP